MKQGFHVILIPSFKITWGPSWPWSYGSWI